jgi:hypothetical protein
MAKNTCKIFAPIIAAKNLREKQVVVSQGLWGNCNMHPGLHRYSCFTGQVNRRNVHLVHIR